MKQPFMPINDSSASSSFEVSDKSLPDNYEKDLYNFITENKDSGWMGLKKIPAFGLILGFMSVFFQL